MIVLDNVDEKTTLQWLVVVVGIGIFPLVDRSAKTLTYGFLAAVLSGREELPHALRHLCQDSFCAGVYALIASDKQTLARALAHSRQDILSFFSQTQSTCRTKRNIPTSKRMNEVS